jgi:hypothetical protein
MIERDTTQEAHVMSVRLGSATEVADGEMRVFDVTSGAVLRGPAERSVRSRTIQNQGEEIFAEA